MRSLRVAIVVASLTCAFSTLEAQAPTARYGAYQSPVSCLGALMRTNIGAGWGYVDDTLGFNPNDMMPKVARDSAADCYRRFYPTAPDVARVPDHEVASLFYWGRATGDDSLAARAFRRALRQQKLRIDTTDLYWHGSYAYGSRPFRLPVAQEMAKRLDELGVVGERPMMPYDRRWQSQHDAAASLAMYLFDTTAIRVETEGERRNYLALPDTARDGAEMTGITTQSRSTLIELVRNPRADSAVAALKARAIEILGENQQQGRWGEGLLLLGERWPALQPDFWFNRAAGDTVYPRPGRVTIVEQIPIQLCTCTGTYAAIRRLKARFGDSVDVVLLVPTQGHWKRRVQLPPAEEAELLRRQLIDSLKLPITLGVYSTRFVAHPAPDNRLVGERVPELKKLLFGGTAIIDRRGIAQMAGLLGLGGWTERALNALLGSLVKAPSN